MRKPLITLLVLLAVAVIVAVITADYLSTRPGKRPANPYAYDVEAFRSVPENMIGWREARQLEIDASPAQAMTFSNGRLYLIAGHELQVIDGDWNRIMRKSLSPDPTCITVTDEGRIIIGYYDRLEIFEAGGELIAESGVLGSRISITSVAELDGTIYAADAANRKVRTFNHQLEQSGEFSGDSGVSDVHGFIVPGGHFSLAVNEENELWITNPGLHAMQNYTPAGRLRSYFQNSSFDISGFSGCCNPVHFAFIPQGGFVTSEKGIVRVKVIKESGELESVVAPSEKFEGGIKAPAVAVDDDGNILLLDFDRNMLRIFEPV